MQSAPQSPLHLAQKATQKMQGTAEVLQTFSKAMAATGQAMLENPHDLMQRSLQLYQGHMALQASLMEHMMGKPTTPAISPAKDDKRFANPLWDDGMANILKQSYLLTSKFLAESVAATEGKLDAHTHHQASFFTRLMIEMMSPTNSPLLNPEVMAAAVASKGESLKAGMANMMADIQAGRIAMTDYEQFKVGETIGCTKGEVVFRNRLIELIQYTPQTPKVGAIPLVICPPWINRFYILDLSPHNSLVNYLVGQGFQVFMISWKNPDASYATTTFDDYLQEGFIAATDAMMSITKQPKINAVGYCIGGAMLGCAAAILNAKGDTRLNSVAFLNALLDYSDTGDINVFIDEAQIQKLEAKMKTEGTLDGRDMAAAFANLRSSDLIWNYVINNYMLGNQPKPFDILYWNDDSTRMPATMHSWYLRNFYLDNNIAKPGKLTLLGTPLDITNITQPAYMLCGQTDHITPWETCYKPFVAMKSANKRFILSKAGHVAGVVNPPPAPDKAGKRPLLAGDNPTAATGQAWLASATQVPDSWWPDYSQWLKPLSGDQIPAPKTLGNSTYKPLEAAPGTYVKEH